MVYLLKRSASDELIRALHAIIAGGMYLDFAIAGKVIGRPARDAVSPQAGQTADLSGREADVLASSPPGTATAKSRHGSTSA